MATNNGGIMSQQPAVYAQPQYPPPTGAPVTGEPGQWTTGLCGCFEDFSSCCITCCCPCITFGRNVEILDTGSTGCAGAGLTYYSLAHLGCCCVYTCTYRSKLRAVFKLPKHPCADFLVHCCCHVCAICQEHRELKNRGLDPSHGWTPNAQKWNQATTTPPTVAPGMGR